MDLKPVAPATVQPLLNDPIRSQTLFELHCSLLC
jgi:hypothetical protein